MRDYGLIELDNGIRVVHQENTNTKIVHLGIMLDIGSRDELPHEQGIAHFWEHMAFKGTAKRNSFHILNRLESVGGELNAYTTKEKICFYASVLQEHVERAFELLVDITFHATFPDKQIDRERMVILEEMSMYEDAPEDAIQDEFDHVIFKDHPLGRNILGTQETVSGFTQKDFFQFIQRNLDTTKIVVSSVGNFDMKKLEALARKYLTDLPTTGRSTHDQLRQPFSNGFLAEKVVEKPISQVHVALGQTAYPIGDERRIPLFLLSNILGGPYMNSKLNLALREKNGLVYAVDAGYQSYLDTGLFAIYFATDPKNFKKSLRLVFAELKNLRNKEMSPASLRKSKQQIKGHMAMSEENNSSIMLMMAKSLLDLGSIPSINYIFDQIEQIEAGLLKEIANDIFPEKLSSLTFQPSPA